MFAVRLIMKLHKLSIALRFSVLALGMIVSQATSAAPPEKVTFFHHDAFGNLVATSDESGNLVSRHTPEPFGATAQRFLDQPKEDGDLFILGARAYDPSIGRFLSPDPEPLAQCRLDKPQSLNRYGYAWNNPYRFHDVSGWRPEEFHPANWERAERNAWHNGQAAGLAIGATVAVAAAAPAVGARAALWWADGGAVATTELAAGLTEGGIAGVSTTQAVRVVERGASSILRKVSFGRGFRHALSKHFGSKGPFGLQKLDPGGTFEKWTHHIVRVAQSSAGKIRRVKSGYLLEATEAMKTESGGTIMVGVRMFRAFKSDSWSLRTILTRQ